MCSEEGMDLALAIFAITKFCDAIPDEHCPSNLEWIVRNGTPLLAAAGPALGGVEDFTQVSRT